MKTFNYESNCVKYKNCFFDLGEYEKGKLSLAIYGYVEDDKNLSHISNVTVNVEEKLEENQVVIDNYANKDLLDMLRSINKNIIILSKNLDSILLKKIIVSIIIFHL